MTSIGAWVHLSKPTEAADNVVGWFWGHDDDDKVAASSTGYQAAPQHHTTTPSFQQASSPEQVSPF
jgi:hypothetical protein